MERKHTKEPWHTFCLGTSAEVRAAPKPPVVNWMGFDDSDRPMQEHEANAHRIVACVNALAAYPDPAAAVAALEGCATAIRRALADEESGKGWGPDVTVCGYLREALHALSAAVASGAGQGGGG